MSAVPDPGLDVSPELFGQEWADDYDELETTDPAETTVMVEAVASLAGPGPVLDVAAATGRLAIPLTRHGLPLVATDASPAMLARLRAKDPAGLVRTRVEVLPDIGGNEAFSLIAIIANSLWVLPNAEQQAAFLRTAAKQLSPGGRLVVDQHEINPAGYAAGQEVGSARNPLPTAKPLRPGHPAVGPPVHRDPPGRLGACPQRPPPADGGGGTGRGGRPRRPAAGARVAELVAGADTRPGTRRW